VRRDHSRERLNLDSQSFYLLLCLGRRCIIGWRQFHGDEVPEELLDHLGI
jgi:hypothetical protein